MKLLLITSLISFVSLSVSAQSFKFSESSFKEIFNNHRVGQPKMTPWAGNFFPYGENGTAVKVGSSSPMEMFDRISGNSEDGENAHNWEKENHTCEKLTGKEKEGCEGWWGHCNGWAAAAIKEPEPRTNITLGDYDLMVGHQKGIFSEVWLSSSSLFEGETDKSTKTAKWVIDPNNYASSSFWDVTPRSFFLIFTNYVGIQETGVVIDRFTGDEVWNQPIVGYRILPLRQKDLLDGGKKVLIRMKIYWANDMGTPHNNLSAAFDINKHTKDSESIEHLPQESSAADYEGRLLEFYLEFDEPVEIAEDGRSVVSSGRLVGQGTWKHFEDAKKGMYNGNWLELNHTHPDFIWLPTAPERDLHSGYGNPFVMNSKVNAIRGISQPVKPNVVRKELSKIKLNVYLSSFTFRGEVTETKIKSAILRVLAREGIKARISLEDVAINARTTSVILAIPSGESAAQIREIFELAGHRVSSASDL